MDYVLKDLINTFLKIPLPFKLLHTYPECPERFKLLWNKSNCDK